MYILEKIKLDVVKGINKTLKNSLVKTSDLVYPPNVSMGDLSLPCFDLAKDAEKSPVEMARNLVGIIKTGVGVKEVKAVGPYLNFVLDKTYLAGELIKTILKEKDKYGRNKLGRGKKIMVEFAHPNTHKAFHIGHLRNIITGEAMVRILENSGYKVIRANFQGDIGMHIAKCLWGVNQLADEYKEAKKGDVRERVTFLGKAYVLGSKNYEENEQAKKEIIALNKKIYEEDKIIKIIYKETRQWSLDYFNEIYKRVNSKFNRFYFESEVFERGREIVLKNLAKGVFKKSDGAVIFEGEKYGLHNRVFINSEGNPTYEGKDVGLAELQFKEHNPEKIIHVVGPEQAEYFKVVFKALEFVMPKSVGREIHLPYGWVKLKEGKMSSRLGNVILGEWLLDEVKKGIMEIVEKNERLKDKEEIAEKITIAAVKYSILKNGLNKDIAFDINESISLSGNSGPYLQYVYARINSILKKSEMSAKVKNFSILSEPEEQDLIFKLTKYPGIIRLAGEKYEPSELTKYLFELAQSFNDYYHSVQILKAEKEARDAKLELILAVSHVIKNGLTLLGIETVEEM